MYETAFANDRSSHSAEPQPTKNVIFAAAALWATVLALLFLPGCNALNPLCGSSRPAPVLSSLSANTITFAQMQQGFLLTVYGKNFVAASVVVINGTTLSTTVQSSQQMQVAIPTNLVSGPGSASVTVNTPAGNSGDLGCSSGGTSSALTLTIT
jgi:IPT/TIG domain